MTAVSIDSNPLTVRSKAYYKLALYGAVGILILNILDMVTTLIALEMGGVEANPISAFLMQYNLIWPLKMFLATAPMVSLWKTKEASVLLGTTIWCVVGWYACVVLVNTMGILRHMGA